MTPTPKDQAQNLTPAAIHSAHTLIKPHIHQTPLLTSKTLNTLASTPQPDIADAAAPTLRFFFKCENYQRIGAFKARGAFHALLRLLERCGGEEVRRCGVVTHSSGEFFLFIFYLFDVLYFMYGYMYIYMCVCNGW